VLPTGPFSHARFCCLLCNLAGAVSFRACCMGSRWERCSTKCLHDAVWRESTQISHLGMLAACVQCCMGRQGLQHEASLHMPAPARHGRSWSKHLPSASGGTNEPQQTKAGLKRKALGTGPAWDSLLWESHGEGRGDTLQHRGEQENLEVINGHDGGALTASPNFHATWKINIVIPCGCYYSGLSLLKRIYMYDYKSLETWSHWQLRQLHPTFGLWHGARSGEGMLPPTKKPGRLNGGKSNPVCLVLNAKI